MNGTAELGPPERPSPPQMRGNGAQAWRGRITAERVAEQRDRPDWDRWDDEGGRTLEPPEPVLP